MKRLIAMAWLGAAVCTVAQEEAAPVRTWTAQGSGRTVEAKFVRLEGGTVHLETADGKQLAIPLAKLAEADRAFIDKAAPVPLAERLVGAWSGLGAGGSVYNLHIVFKKVGSKLKGEGTISGQLRQAQVEAAYKRKLKTAEIGRQAIVLEQTYDVAFASNLVQVTGTKVNVLVDGNDANAAWKPDLFELEFKPPGLLEGVWKGATTGLVYLARDGVTPEVPPLALDKGKTLRRECGGGLYHYTCYIPKRYDPAVPAPLLVNDSPSTKANPLSPAMAEEFGWIMIGLTESGNDTPGWKCSANIVAALADLQRHVRLDPKRYYFSGFSGGARRSAWWARCFADHCAGIICIGAGFDQIYEGPRRGEYLIPPRDLPVFFIVGQTDMNHGEVVKRVHPQEKSAGRTVELVVHPGGHTWGRPEDHEAAIRWLAKQQAPGDAAGKPRPGGTRR